MKACALVLLCLCSMYLLRVEALAREEAFNTLYANAPTATSANAQLDSLWDGTGFSDPGQAVTLADKILSIDANNWQALNARGVARVQRRQYILAESDFSRSLQINPKYAPLYSNRCNARKLSGQFTKALQDCSQAVKMMPNDWFAKYNRAAVNRLMGKGELAHRELEQVLIALPGYAPAWVEQALTLAQLKRYGEATVNLKKAQELAPGYAPVYYAKGVISTDIQKTGDALSAYKKAMNLAHPTPDQADNYAKALCQAGKCAQGIDVLTSLLQENPTYGPAWIHRGMLNYGRQDVRAMCGDLKQGCKYGFCRPLAMVTKNGLCR